MRPYLFGAIPTRGTSENEKVQRDEGGGTALTRIQVKEMIGTENFWWSEENYCDSRHLRGNIDGFLRDGKSAILNETQIGHVATFVYKM